MAKINDKDSYYCERCKKTKKGSEFYSSNNLEKYPNGGKLNQCKQCITMHVDNWNPETYLWILKEIDVPYIPEEWNKLLAKFAKPGDQVTGLSILGRYLSAMKLNQHKRYRWADTEELMRLANKKIEETMRQSGYSETQIAEAIAKGHFEMPEKPLAPADESGFSLEDSCFNNPHATSDEIVKEMGLTEEDVVYLRLKWGKAYRPDEWVWLEQLYEEMMGSYDIQTAGHLDTLKLVCKTSLKANQLLDLGDVDGAQKMIKMYDGLMKSGKFTAAQNKAEQGEYVDSISELVAMCEKDGFIPRYYTDGPQDKVDKVILDMQDYVRTLVLEEMHLGPLIEKALKTIEDEKLREAELDIDEETEEEAFERELFAPHDDTEELDEQDYVDFTDFEDELEAADDELLMDDIGDE